MLTNVRYNAYVHNVDTALHEAPVGAPVDELLALLDERGYLFFRGLLRPARILELRRAVLGALDECGWLTGDPTRAIPSSEARREEADADPAYFVAYRAIQQLQVLHELAHDPALVATMATLLGEPVLVHPRKIARIGLPKDDLVVGAHQDHPLIQGTADVLTAWIPVGDCPDVLGGLNVLEGSHRAGLLPVEHAPNVGGLRIASSVEGVWKTADFRAGDVLVFHSLTVHAAKRNNTDELRLSVDFRYQAATDPIVEGSLLPHYFPLVPGHDELTRGWTATGAVALPGEPNLVPTFDPFDDLEAPLQSRLVSI
jgi:hypothetical protein